ncbi:hypothetical protein DTO271G3_773 [Paecilomyces variotii]|nr:hypothetical protein DTO271G3_773 [Paecilomyces variotii]
MKQFEFHAVLIDRLFAHYDELTDELRKFVDDYLTQNDLSRANGVLTTMSPKMVEDSIAQFLLLRIIYKKKDTDEFDAIDWELSTHITTARQHLQYFLSLRHTSRMSPLMPELRSKANPRFSSWEYSSFRENNNDTYRISEYTWAEER